MQDGTEDELSEDGLLAFAHFIICPPRAQYTLKNLGKPRDTFGSVNIARHDFEVKNARNEKLQCSIWEPLNTETTALPCVVYLHGNGSCRVEAQLVAPLVLPYGFKLVGFDFSGSGLSDGQYISLGVFERDDVAHVVEHLNASGRVSRFALWGHSMGAATAILYCGSNVAALSKLNVCCAVFDSTYASFDHLAASTVNRMQLPPGVPKRLLLTVGVRKVRKYVRQKAGFDLGDVQPIRAARKCTNVPCIMLHGTEDQVVDYEQSEAVYKVYACADKQLVRLEGAHHDSPRPRWAEDRIFLLLQRYLAPDVVAQCLAIKTRANEHLLNGYEKDAATLYNVIVELWESLSPQGSSEQVKRKPSMYNGPLSTAPQAVGQVGSPSTRMFRWRKLFRRKSCFPVAVEQKNVHPPERPTTPRLSADGGEDVDAARARRHTITSSSFVRPSTADDSASLKDTRPGNVGPSRNSFIGVNRPQESTPAVSPAPTSRRQGLRGWERSRSKAAKRQLASGPAGDAATNSPEPPVNLTDEDRRRLLILLATVYSNRSLARVRMGEFEGALSDADKIIKLDQAWGRGYQRKAEALLHLEKHDQARRALEDGLRVDTRNAKLQQMLAQLLRWMRGAGELVY